MYNHPGAAAPSLARLSPGHPRAGGRRALAAIAGLVLGLATAAAAQYPVPSPSITPVPPTTTGPISLIGIGGVSQISPTGFRLTASAPYQAGAVWRIDKQPVAAGFQSTFQFQISGIGGIIGDTPFGLQQGGDGFTFAIQNYGIPVVGPPAGFLGYDGLPNSLVVEFDTWMNLEPGFLDPNGNHISVHTQGTGANSASEAASIGQATAIPFMKDGAVHTASVVYTPGTLSVYLDNLTSPVLTIPNVNLSSLLSLDNGTAWIGFTAATGSAFETHDILAWQFTAGVPVTTPVPTTPTVPPTTVPTTGTTIPPTTGITSTPPTFVFPSNP